MFNQHVTLLGGGLGACSDAVDAQMCNDPYYAEACCGPVTTCVYPGDCQIPGCAAKNPSTCNFTAAPDGKTAWYDTTYGKVGIGAGILGLGFLTFFLVK